MSNTWRQPDADGYEMHTPKIRRTRAELERLLDGRPVRQDALTELISAARASEVRVEGAGFAAALAAFRSVSSPYAQASPRRSSMIKNVAAKLAAAKLLTIGGVALAATGGVAAAASTGHLPSPLPHSSHASSVAVAAVAKSHGKPSSTPSASASGSASATDSNSSSSSPGTHPSATLSPSLRGLCRSWLSRPHEHGKADTNPAFTVLVTAAGGTDAVPGYCTTLLSTAPGQPTPSDSPTDSSSATPTESATPSHPTGKPSSRPTPSHPSGKPTALPTPSHPTGH